MKRGIYILITLLSIQIAHALGISPASYQIDFEPNLEKTLQFKILDVNQALRLYVEGDLNSSITLEKQSLSNNST